MTRDEFQDLALRALESPGDEPAVAALRQALESQPEYRDDWQSLCALYAQSGAALAQAEPPATAVVHTRWLHRWQPWVVLAAAAAVAVGVFVWRAAPTESLQEWRESGPASLRTALTAPLPQLLAAAQPAVFRSGDSVQLQSPLIAATAGPVEIAWRGGKARVQLERDGTVIWTQTGDSPLTSPALPADGVYQLEINLLEQPATKAVRETFVTVTAGKTGAGLSGVLQAATADPSRLGEAVLAFHRLPTAVRQSEDGQRIALWLAERARQPDLLPAAQNAK